jgi:hypothetical protein
VRSAVHAAARLALLPLPALLALAAFACSSSSGTTSQSGTDAGGDTWTSYAQGFTATYCVECHGPSDPTGRDFTQYAKVAAAKAEIRCGVATSQDTSWGCASFPPAEQFPISDGKNPPNPKPSSFDRARYAAWISAGAPQ